MFFFGFGFCTVLLITIFSTNGYIMIVAYCMLEPSQKQNVTSQDVFPNMIRRWFIPIYKYTELHLLPDWLHLYFTWSRNWPNHLNGSKLTLVRCVTTTSFLTVTLPSLCWKMKSFFTPEKSLRKEHKRAHFILGNCDMSN